MGTETAAAAAAAADAAEAAAETETAEVVAEAAEAAATPAVVVVESETPPPSAAGEVSAALELDERIRALAREEANRYATDLIEWHEAMEHPAEPIIIEVPPEDEHHEPEPDKEPEEAHWWYRSFGS